MPVTPPPNSRLPGLRFGGISGKGDGVRGRNLGSPDAERAFASAERRGTGLVNVKANLNARRAPVKAHQSWETEVIPDSEEERVQVGLAAQGPTSTASEALWSDDDLFGSRELQAAAKATAQIPVLDDPFVDMPGAWPVAPTPAKKKLMPPINDWTPRSSPQITKTRKFSGHRRLHSPETSSDSECEVALIAREIVELDSDGSPVQAVPRARPTPSVKSTRRGRPPCCSKISSPGLKISEKPIPLFEDDDDDDDDEENHQPKSPLPEPEDDDFSDDSAILILDEPRIARPPLRIPISNAPPTTTPPQRRPKATGASLKVKGDNTSPVLQTPVDVDFPSVIGKSNSLPTPVTPTTKKASPTKQQPPRTGKKAQAAAERARREAYAQQLFDELNKTVFGNELPSDTKLMWNKRLLTTAGRAKWNRSKEGVETSSIELAEKILDCDERIRNTLSHEMCHLATWTIDNNPKEGHGRLWTKWTKKVMKKRPDIDITTKHDYEISYPFEWECENCKKIYGRFTKSIRPDECVCGVCREGRLLPLFATRSRGKSKTPKASKMAADRPRDSPMRTPQMDRGRAPDSDDREIIELFSDEEEGDGVRTGPDDLDRYDDAEVDALVKRMSIVTIDYD
ncbi:hypothetical protein AX16_000560 [Volvariella volvacea WC 439]|nr:hypothetical protein AX16_000560 [Volvariella volvacea WC 439]